MVICTYLLSYFFFGWCKENTDWSEGISICADFLHDIFILVWAKLKLCSKSVILILLSFAQHHNKTVYCKFLISVLKRAGLVYLDLVVEKDSVHV
jgi:hypothetical protein